MTDNLDQKTRQTVAQRIAALLQENYVFPDTGDKMAAHIRNRLEQGGYDAIHDVHEFARAMEQDTASIAFDGHLQIVYDPELAANFARNEAEGDQRKSPPDDRWLAQMPRENYGFKKVEHLTGNIGYIDLRMFAPAEYGGQTAVSAMNLLVHCDALIFDLRQNHGGYPSMVQLITSYLFEAEAQHLNTFHIRPSGKYQQFWTFPHVPGQRMPDIPVYVLTGKGTFSAAEEFTYNLKNMKRATIVGEVTGGGAHPREGLSAGQGFVIFIPIGRPINPITGDNWEGTGVEPDITVPSEKALETAHVHALEQLVEASSDSERARLLKWSLDTVKIVYNPVVVDESVLSGYAGKYDNHTVTLQDGALFITFDKYNITFKLETMSDTLFAIDDKQRIKFAAGSGNQDSALVMVYRDDGREVTVKRTGA